ELGADDGVGARPVLDHHRLAPVLAHLLADQAREHVGGPAGGERHHDLDRAAGEGLRALPRGGGSRQQREQSRRDRASVHGVLPYSTLMPVSLITFSQRAASMRMKAANASGVLVTG